MFDIAPSEFLLVAIVAIVVIGPKDLPLALRTAGRWIGQMRRISGHFRSGIEAMIREAEMAELEKKWREQNAAIMAAHPALPDPAAGQTAESAQDQIAPAPAPAPDPAIAAHAPTEPHVPAAQAPAPQAPAPQVPAPQVPASPAT